MAQTGYPWTLDLHVVYDLSADGLTVTQTATNLSDRPAPYASGAHPYLSAGPGPVDGWELTLPAVARGCSPTSGSCRSARRTSTGTPYDFRVARPVRDTVLDHAFGDLARDADGVATAVVRDPATGLGAALWVDRHHPWLMVFSADDGRHRAAAGARRGADDRAARRVPQRPRPAHPGPGRRAGRRGVSLLGDPGARVTPPAVRASSIRSWRTAILARSPSADWIASAWRAGAVGEVEDRERRARAAGAPPAPRPTRRRGAGSR